MADVIKKATNKFTKGLIMDFSPENTQNEVLTHALNATLLTFNGNEMSLLNDMGNSRVETAFLPDGYVPVGSCEFGDIIYIVSYNPLIDKAQIGCFPSPERNLSSDELGQEPVVITYDKFLNVAIKYYTIPPMVNKYVESTKEQYENIEGNKRDYDKLPTEIEYDGRNPKYPAIRVITPSGRLKTGSIKEILYKSNLNSGDQYIITYDKNLNNVTDYETTIRSLNTLPKLLNIKVVSIEDSGKINILDSNVKWYDLTDKKGESKKYFKFIHNQTSTQKIDIDNYRTIVSSAYNTYSSKISGKLALLIELEKISGFSCGWEAVSLGSDADYNNYDIYLNYSWETDNKNINPKYTILTESSIKDKFGNAITSNTDIRSKISVPNIYNEYNPEPLHEFGRIYEPENAKVDYLYETYVLQYLTSKNIPTNVTNIQLVFENNEFLFKSEPQVSNTEKKVLIGNYTINENDSSITISDDIINNTFKTQVRKKLATFKVPKNEIDINYHYTVCPAMPYGMLEEFSIRDVIQLDKLGTTNIQVKDWRYYNYSNLLTLTWGLDAYIEPGKEIKEVVLEFYDNYGICAAYHASNYHSYNGTFTINIPLEKKNSVLNNITWENKTFIHAGKLVVGHVETDENGLEVPYYSMNKEKFNTYTSNNNQKIGYTYTRCENRISNKNYYYDDSGILYSNLLYLVKIIVRVENPLNKNSYSNLPVIFYRWLWTNSMFNMDYQKVDDFDYLKPTLKLDLNCSYSTKQNEDDGLIKWEVTEQINESLNSISTFSQNINNEEYSNIKLIPNVCLTNNYSTFTLNSDNLKKMNVTVSFANEYIENSSEQPLIEFYDKTISVPNAIAELNSYKNESTFKIKAKQESSQYAIDVSMEQENNYFKLNKYGKLL